MAERLSDDELYNLWLVLRRTDHVILKVRNQELGQYGVSAVAAGVLLVVHSSDGKVTPAEISRQILREAHSVSGLVSRMEKAGFVRKIKDLDRKNQVRVELTEKGREAYNNASKREKIHRIMSVLSEAEREQLMSYLKRIREAALKEL